MPNRVALLRAEIEAAHRGAVMRHRGEAGFSMSVGHGVSEHRYTTGPWHWHPDGEQLWREIDTDLEDRPDPVWRRGVRSARFDTVVADDGRRRFYPRRWVGEYAEFGPLEWETEKAGAGREAVWAAPTLGVGELRGENGLRGAGNRLAFDRPTHSFEVGFNGKGCRTQLTLKDPSVARPLRWAVTLHGLDWKDGALVSLKDGQQVGFIRPPSWSDATEDKTPREIPWVFEKGYVTLTPDFKDAVFPVVIDPDYSTSAADDGGVAATTFSATNAIFDVGKPTPVCHGWFRFAGITATQGQDCTAATIAFTCAYSAVHNILSDLFGVDEPSSAAPTTYDTWNADHGIHTTATTAWDITADLSAGTAYSTPDLSPIFDELFGIAEWVTNNAVGIHWDDGGSASGKYQEFATYENTTYTEPILSLTLAAGGEDDKAEPACLGTSSAFPAPTVQVGSSLSPALLSTTSTFPAPTAQAITRTSPACLTTTSTFPAPTLRYGGAVAAACLTTVSAFLAVTLAAGATTSPAPLTTTSTFPAVTVQAGSTVSPALLGTTSGFPAPTLAAGATTSPALLSTTSAFPAVTIGAGSTVSPALLSTASTFPAPTVQVGSSLSPALLSTTSTFPAPTLPGGSSVSPALLSTASTFPAPTVQAGATVSPASLATASSFPAVATAAGSTTSPASLATTSAFPAVTLHAGTATSPASLATASTFPAPTVQVGSSISPALLSTASTFPAPTVQVGSSLSPALLSTASTFPAPSLPATGTVSPACLTTSSEFPHPIASSGVRAAVTRIAYIDQAVGRTGYIDQARTRTGYVDQAVSRTGHI